MCKGVTVDVVARKLGDGGYLLQVRPRALLLLGYRNQGVLFWVSTPNCARLLLLLLL